MTPEEEEESRRALFVSEIDTSVRRWVMRKKRVNFGMEWKRKARKRRGAIQAGDQIVACHISLEI